MPIYEYQCLDCRRCSSFLIRSLNETASPICSFCRSGNLQRIMSRFSAVKSEESRIEHLADPGRWGGLDENDPAGVAKFVKHMGRELGEDISRDEIDQMADEAAHEAENGTGADDSDSAVSMDPGASLP